MFFLPHEIFSDVVLLIPEFVPFFSAFAPVPFVNRPWYARSLSPLVLGPVRTACFANAVEWLQMDSIERQDAAAQDSCVAFHGSKCSFFPCWLLAARAERFCLVRMLL